MKTGRLDVMPKKTKAKTSEGTAEATSEKPQSAAGAAADAEAPPSEEPAYRVADASEFGRNMARVAVQSRELISAFLKSQAERAGREPLDPLNVTGAYFTLLQEMAANP